MTIEIFSSSIIIGSAQNQTTEVNGYSLSIYNNSASVHRFIICGYKVYETPPVQPGSKYVLKNIRPMPNRNIYISVENDDDFDFDDYIGLYFDTAHKMILNSGFDNSTPNHFYIKCKNDSDNFGYLPWDRVRTNVSEDKAPYIALDSKGAPSAFIDGNINYLWDLSPIDFEYRT